MREIIVFACLFLALNLAFSQSYSPTISEFTTTDGLSSNKIYAIHKDVRGFIWIGTDEGLNRFDGQNFKVYSSDNQPDMTFLSVHEIFEDDEGYLWLLKKNDIYDQEYKSPQILLLNIYTNQITTPEKHFKAKMPFKVEDIGFIKALEDGQIYFYCNELRQGFKYSSSSGFKPFFLPQDILSVDDIVLQEDGNYLVQGETNLYPQKWEIFKVDKNGNVLAKRNPSLVTSFDEKGKLFQAKFDGISLLPRGYNLDAYNYFSPDLSFGTSNIFETERIIQTAWNKNQKLLWISNQKEFRVVRPDGKVVYQLKEKLDEKSVPILFDGNITWLSNRRDGLVAIHLKPNYFTNYRFFEEDLDNSTRGIYQDEEGITWVSTVKGTAQINTQNEVINKKRSQIFTRFLKDSKDNLWYFQDNGLVKQHLKSQEKTLFPMNGGFESWSLLAVENNEVWFSGFNGAILETQSESGTIKRKAVLPSNTKLEFHVYEYLKKDSSSFWLCTNQGLYVVGKDGRTLAIFNKDQKGKNYLPTGSVHHIYQDENEVIWLATGDAGLLKLRMKNGELELLKQYTKTDGLSSNSLHAVYEDDFDYLWISSDVGLIQFDKRSEQFYKYFTEDGIPHNEFNRIAHFKGKDGQLFFGGILGVTTFHPKHFSEVRNQTKGSPLAITGFRQYSFDEEKFNDLTSELLQTKSITLQPFDQFFNLDIALLNFDPNHQTTFQYRIGNKSDWQSSSDGKLSISGLSYGQHDLQIKAFDGNQIEAANDLNFSINVLKPFYLQWWFSVLLLSISTLGGWVVWRRRKPILENKPLINSSPKKEEILKKKKVTPIVNIQKTKKEKVVVQTEVALQQEELDWIKTVEDIAQREVRNPNYNIEELSKELIMSRRQVFRRIKKITGLTPKKYLISIRLQKAKLILETEDISTLKEICYSVGFENTTHFSNLYETEFGKRPHELIKKTAF